MNFKRAKHLLEADFDFLDRWKPPLWVMPTPATHTACTQFKAGETVLQVDLVSKSVIQTHVVTGAEPLFLPVLAYGLGR